MPLIELPHSPDCLVCGKNNPRGLGLNLFVEPENGEVHVRYEPTEHHVGFSGIVHGGAMAAVVDEAMVWAATWRGKRFCVCGELTVRYRRPLNVSRPVDVVAHVEFSRPRLIETAAKFFDAHDHTLLATASGKYVPVEPDQHRSFLATFIEDPATAQAIAALR